MNPYVPIFRRTAARMTDPAVGASVCASGSQVWNGNIGTLMAKPMKSAPKIHTSLLCGSIADAFYALPLTGPEQLWLFLAFAIAFAIKVPMFPFHTWLPDAHVEAPTAGSVILAAVLLKMGTFGFIRYAIPLFPVASAHFTPWIVALALVGIIYGALVAMVQPDLKKLVAYSSVSHLGFCMLGLYAMNQQGFAGSMLQMLNHGISTGALFLLIGMIYESHH